MNAINPSKVGLVLAALGGGWHLIWSILVAAGCAQAVLNFVFWMHFLVPPYTVKPFQLGVAAILVAVTATFYYAIGWLLGVLWNWIHR